MTIDLGDAGTTWDPAEVLDLRPDIKVYRHIGGVAGVTMFRDNSISLRDDLTVPEWRSTLSHELLHVIRGPVLSRDVAREELEVERVSARKLVPIDDLGEALAIGSLSQAERFLRVDARCLRARLHSLNDQERSYLRSRLGLRTPRNGG